MELTFFGYFAFYVIFNGYVRLFMFCINYFIKIGVKYHIYTIELIQFIFIMFWDGL